MKKQLLLLFFLCSTLIYAADPYTLTASDVVITDGEITGYTNSVEKDIIIPSSLDGQTVTSIGIGAFKGKSLTSVTLPSSVTIIKEFAFNSNQLTSVSIPNSVTEIEAAAFSQNKLTSVMLPNSVTEIGVAAFADNQLTSVTIPNLVNIELGAFNSNSDLSVLELGDPSEEEGKTFEGWFATEDFSGTAVTSVLSDFEGYVKFYAKYETLSIDDETINTVRVYPNPSDGHFKLDLGDQVPTHISVYDLTGKLVSKLPNKSIQDVDINVSQGIYILQIETASASKQMKFLINK